MRICVTGAARGQQWLWGAPTVKQVRVAWKETEHAAARVATFLKSESTVTFPGGGRILFVSLDEPDNARGYTADGIVIDESGDVREAAWYEVLRPMLLDTGGESWCIGTPKGQNWFWRECMAAADRPDSRFWNAPTMGAAVREGRLVRRPHPLENTEIDWHEIEQLYRTLPERVFRQEILAEFLEDSGGVFLRVREAVDRGRIAAEPALPGQHYCLGVDLARVEDFTVLTVLSRDRRQVFMERFNRISWERQVETIARVSRAYNAPVALDVTGLGDPVYEAVRKADVAVLPYPFTSGSKEQLIDGLAIALEAGELSLMDLPVQTTELLAYQYHVTPSRNVRMGAPEGLHDDTVIALALAHWGLGQGIYERPAVGGERPQMAVHGATGGARLGREPGGLRW